VLDKEVVNLGIDALEFYSSGSESNSDSKIKPKSEFYLTSVYSEKSGYYLPKISDSQIKKKIKKKKNHSFSRKTEQGQWLSALVHSEDTDSFFIVSKVLPFTLLQTIDAVTESRQEFQKTKAFRIPLKSTYYFILTSMTLVILAFGGWFSLYLAQSLSRPIFAVREATQNVSKGEFSPIRFKTGMTELNALIQNFNSMILELKSTRVHLKDSVKELEQSSLYIKSVLSQVSSGVMSFDENFDLTYFNKRAQKIFSLKEPVKKNILPSEIVEMLKNFKSSKDEVYVQEVDIKITQEKILSLQVSISNLRTANLEGYGALITVEDVDLLRENQRVKAWKEVATRVAHEIKNPLTPVKLSAERLLKKFSKDIDDPIFKDCIKTIIDHVDLIKNLVNEFNQFARFPQMKPVVVNVQDFFERLSSLYKVSHPDLHFKFMITVESLIWDSEKMNRVFINLIENSVEAMSGSENKTISIKVEKNSEAKDSMVFIEFIDSGPGVDEAHWQTVFNSKYTTKANHSGLGLSIVKKIIEDHRGRISIGKDFKGETRFLIEMPQIKI